MTREEQIQKKAYELGQMYFPNEHNIWARENIEAKYVELACIEAVKWADENPKEGLVSIDRVCDWLEEHMSEFCSECAEQALISWLRKAMEE